MKSFSRIFGLASKLLLAGIFFFAGNMLAVFAAPPGSPYNPGESLAPTCAPGDANCSVTTPHYDGVPEAWFGVTESAAQNTTGITLRSFGYESTDTSTTTGWAPYALFDTYVEPSAAQAVGTRRVGLAGYSTISNTNTNQVRQVTAMEGGAENYGTGAIETLFGLVGWGYNAANATIGQIAGGWIGGEHDDGALTNAYGAVFDFETYGGTVTNVRGININPLNVGGGTVTNRYGIYIQTPNGTATNDWGIYQEGAQNNFFAGNVGIGTNAPTDLLELLGNGDADLNLTTYENGGTDNSTIHFYFANGSSSTPTAVTDSETVAAIEGAGWDGTAFRDIGAIYMVTDGTTGASDTPGAIQFLTSSDGTSTLLNRMEIGNDGDVIINPGNAVYADEELHIAADLAGSSDTAISIENSNAGPTYVYEIHVEDTNEFVIYQNQDENSANSVLMYNGATQHWGFGTDPTANELQMDSGAHITAGGVFTDASSRAYKTGIESISFEEAFAAFNQLNPVRFQYKEQPGEEYLGFIAEDVPDLVATADRKGLAPMDIVAVLTKVLQEQQKQIEELQEAVRKLTQ